MWIGAGQASAQLAFFSWLRAAGGATNRQGQFLFGFHGYTMHYRSRTKWSIVTSRQARLIAILTRDRFPTKTLGNRFVACMASLWLLEITNAATKHSAA
jgi:hypothetical protein